MHRSVFIVPGAASSHPAAHSKTPPATTVDTNQQQSSVTFDEMGGIAGKETAD